MTRPPFAVDFKSIPRLSFNLSTRKQEEEDDERGDVATGKPGQTFLSHVTARRLAAVKRAGEVLTVLPGEGESLHCILLGYFDLLNVVLALLDRAGSPCSVLRIATLSFSKRNVAELAGLLDAGAVKTLDLLTSHFQKEHDGEILAVALEELSAKRGQRVAAARSHCKLICIALEDGRRYTIEGSANLRTSRNQEQFALSRDAALWGFYDAWLASMVKDHEIGRRDDPPTS